MTKQAIDTCKRKSQAMTDHLLNIEKKLGRHITPAEVRSPLFAASRELYVEMVTAAYEQVIKQRVLVES